MMEGYIHYGKSKRMKHSSHPSSNSSIVFTF